MEDEDDDVAVGDEIVLFGTVGESYWGDGFTARDVLSALAGKGDVTVRLNSGGGDAFEGSAIYSILKAHAGRVTVRVEGVAASAASLVAMAGDEVEMADGAMLMIHDPAMWVSSGRGTADDHRRDADMLDKVADSYAAIYARKAGVEAGASREVMRAETWMTADDAVAAGYADRKGKRSDAEASAFDFTLYGRAPAHLRALAERNGWRKPAAPAAVAASTRKEPAMADKPEAAVETTPAVLPTPTVDVTAATAAAVKAERERIAAIRRGVTAAKLGDDVAAKLIDDGVSVEAASAAIIDALAARSDQAPTVPAMARGGRLDERETMRAGVEMAIEAQLARTPAGRQAGMKVEDVDARARPFMDMGFAEMAAQMTGYRGALRSPADRERVLMAGFHSTSDFPAIFENVLNKTLLARYRQAAPTYRRIARQISFNDFRPHPMVRTGDFPQMRQINENGEIQFGTIGESKETVSALSYAIGLRLSRPMMINDDMNAIAQMLADRGAAIARFEDSTFYAMMISGANSNGPTLATTTRQVFNATDASLAGTPATIDVASLSLGRAAIRKRTGLDGALLDLTPSILLVGPDRETVAQQVVAPLQADQVGQVNPFSGRLDVVVTSRITGNAWYLFVEPSELPCFVWGFLSGYEAPRVRIEEPFGTQGVALTVEHDFGCGAIDFRGGWRNAGA